MCNFVFTKKNNFKIILYSLWTVYRRLPEHRCSRYIDSRISTCKLRYIEWISTRTHILETEWSNGILKKAWFTIMSQYSGYLLFFRIWEIAWYSKLCSLLSNADNSQGWIPYHLQLISVLPANALQVTHDPQLHFIWRHVNCRDIYLRTPISLCRILPSLSVLTTSWLSYFACDVPTK
jgi:hypothetical protein